MSKIDLRLTKLGLQLPAAAAPAANYVPFVVHGDLLHIAGQIPFLPDGTLLKGRLGDTLDTAGGQAAVNKPVSRSVDANVKAAETKLMRTLHTNVKILQGKKGTGGKIDIEYYNTDDLDRIFQAIVKK